MELFVDDDGYICFKDGNVFWTLHRYGWEAYMVGKLMPSYGTGEVTFPTDDDLAQAYKFYEESNAKED